MSNARVLPLDYMNKAINRLDLKQLCTWILSGSQTYSTELNYNERLVNGSNNIKNLIEATFTDTTEQNTAYDYLSEALGTYSDVYVEIGVQIGAHLMVQLLNNKEIQQ